mmetsp:Transcript_26334/g.69159  ORF Transcript_26334/g.69159 Transcript_26334/m.69159 type:complete len:352 (-) Transcript_26334:36-1091(-)
MAFVRYLILNARKQVLASAIVENPANDDLFKMSRITAENMLILDTLPAPIKPDISAQLVARDLFKIEKSNADPETAKIKPVQPTNAYIPDTVSELDLISWSQFGLGGPEACRVSIAVRQLAATRPWLKAVRFFGKFFGRNKDYYVCEGEMTGPDERPPDGLKPNNYHRRNLEKVVHHNRFKYFVCSAPGAPWTALPNVRFDQLFVAGRVRKLLTGEPTTPFSSYPPFPGATEAEYLRARIALIAMATTLSPAGYFVEKEIPPAAEGGRPELTISFNPEWAPAEDPAALLAPAGWTRHYPPMPIPDAFGEDFKPDENGQWPPVDPEPYTLRPLADDADAATPPPLSIYKYNY